MVFPTRVYAIGVGLVFLVGTLAHAQEKDKPNILRGTEPRSFGGSSYPKKWAVIVGINYKPSDREPLKKGTVNKLENAERDAQAVADHLMSHYGYGKEEVILLLGKDATKDAIEAKLRDGLLCKAAGKVGPRDSVLFYFAGHGSATRHEGKLDRGYLWPLNVTVNDKNEVETQTAIDIRYEADHLAKHCVARHKLLILDCCYSGAIFLDGSGSSGHEHRKMAKGLFLDPAFQAITAGRASEPVADGQEGHSPFTRALLRAWKTIPLRLSRDTFYFTTNQLFISIQFYLDGTKNQLPLCRWLDGNQGEFHFFPDSKADFAEDVDPRKERDMLLAMVPSTFGNWWVDEVPWFMPSLRYLILENKPETRNGREEIHAKLLEKTAKGVVGRPELTQKQEVKLRLKHMNDLLDADTQQRSREVMEGIVKDLEKAGQAALEVADKHYLAVLYHKLGQANKAEETYKEAEALYQELRPKRPELRPLEALCKADFGYFYLNVKEDYGKAARNFSEARRMFAMHSPAPFQIFTLCREADAHRRAGDWGLSDERMTKALNILRWYDKSETFHLSAATWKQHAWAFMEQWRFREAKDSFERAALILNRPDLDRFEAHIDRFHVEHGLAMTFRFQGDARTALKKYRELTSRIAKKIRELDGSREPIDNSAEIRALLYQRLVNSLQRQGDCNLFSGQPDYGEAADDYRRAIRECANLSFDWVKATQADLLLRRAVALSLDSPAKDSDLAIQLCDQADRLMEPKEGTLLYFTSAFARGLAKCSHDPVCQDEALDQVRQAIKKRRGISNAPIIRDDLEAMMLATRILLERGMKVDEKGKLKNRLQLSEDADLLFEFCRAAQRTKDPDPETLKYLRPFYDVVFEAKLAARPKQAKELIEVAGEACRGNAHSKPEQVAPLLVLHYTRGKVFLLLDVPNGPSESCEVEEEYTADQLRAASEKGELLLLPNRIRKALRGTTQLVVRWHDPVWRLGYPANTEVVSAKPVGSRIIFMQPHASARFPFELKRVLAQEAQVQDDRIGVEFGRDVAAGEGDESSQAER